MNLKSLLLGSAAVLVAGATARAADAVMVEPEPIEYVRVCDAYGAGWFYIPGTETCLKFDGDTRVQVGSIHYHDSAANNGSSNHEWDYRARLNVRASSETEYGTLYSRIRFVGQSNEGGHQDFLSVNEGPYSAPVLIDTAIITLGGFNLGYDYSYWHRAGDWGYYEARFDGLFIEQYALYGDYTFEANGWTLTLGAQDGRETGTSGAPDPYAGVTYTGAGLYLAGLVFRDNSQEAEAWKVRADYDLSFLPGGKLGAFYMADDGKTDYVKGITWGVTGEMNLTDNMILFGGYSVYDDQTGDPLNASAKNWTLGVAWDIVPGLRIQPEYTATWYGTESAAADQLNYGRWSLRIERSF